MFSFLKLLPNFLPYSGPCKVGTAEYEFASSSLSQDFESAPVTTIRFRLFYPAKCIDPQNQNIPWIPEPQDAYINGYLKLGKAGPWLSAVLRQISWWVKSTSIPVHRDAQLDVSEAPRRVLVFSHGLVGGINTNSAVLGELASHGFVCVAIEHRDGSGPVALIRDNNKASETHESTLKPVYYQNISLKIKPGVLEKRDQQLRIRLFELMATYQALQMLNEGELPRNLARGCVALPRSCLDLQPGHVIWAGHSFGGTTIVQFLKSIFYAKENTSHEANPLLSVAPFKTILDQILPQSALILLDPWFMPLKSTATEFLSRKPLPCYTNKPQQRATACTVMSSEFAWHWPECHSHMPAILSADPSSVEVESQETYEQILAKYPSPRAFIDSSRRDQIRHEALVSNLRSIASPHLDTYVLNDTTHTTLTDFGVLFPWLSYWFTGQKCAQSATDNVVRCILKVAGFDEALWHTVPRNGAEADEQLEKIT